MVIQTELRDNTEHLNMLEENFTRASEDVVAYQVGKERILSITCIRSIYILKKYNFFLRISWQVGKSKLKKKRICKILLNDFSVK